MKHDIFKRVTHIFGVLSLVLVVSTVYIGWEELSFYGSGSETLGKVIGFDTQYRDGRKLLFPIVSFSDKSGIPHISRSNLATIYGGIHKVGDSYSMIYNDEQPSFVRENSFFGLFGKLLLVAFMTYLNFVLLLIFNYYLTITPATNTHEILKTIS